MGKIVFKPGTMLNPVPAVMVSCGDGAGADDIKNIVTIAWTGIINTEPPITYVSVRKSRYSYDIIERTGEFVINLVTEDIVESADWCGVKSGRDFDKFKERGLTPVKSEVVSAPAIAESPVNIECRVIEKKEFGTHDMFIAEIVSVSADAALMNESGRLCLDKAGLISYSHGEYFGLKSKPLGCFGYSVMKPKTKKRLRREAQSKKKH